MTREPTYAYFYEPPELEPEGLAEIERTNLIRQCAMIAVNYGLHEPGEDASPNQIAVSNRSLMTYHSIMCLLEPGRSLQTSIAEAILARRAMKS